MADDNSTEFGRRMARFKQRAAEAEANAERRKAEEPKQLFLPGFDIGTMPSHLNRSSLFAPVARGRRKLHNDTVMVSRSDCVLEYSGEQLDESDADLIMALIWFAQRQPIGEHVPLERAELLRRMGRKTGNSQYQWLHKSLKRLRKGTLVLQAKKRDGSTRYHIGKMETFNIVKELSYDDETEQYTYMLDARWVEMFSNREYALLDWDARLHIGRGQDMAKTLQRLVATTSDPVQRYALDRLKAQMQYGGRMRDFRAAIRRAAGELERVGVIARARVDKSTKGKPQLVIHMPGGEASA